MKKKRFDEDIWLISKVYSGSSCDLFLAFWPEEDEQVIIKAVKPEISNDDKGRIEERLLKEASTLEEFWNPSFPKVYDIRRTKENDQLYLILEHFEGNSLRDYLNIHREKGIDRAFLNSFITQMQKNLSYLHGKKNLCHLDLTPENIIITTDNEVKIIDFEEAQVIGQTVKTTRVRGKENYLAPEFETPQEGIIHSGAADIYALGIMIKEVFDQAKGLKSSQKSYYLNIIRACTNRRVEVRPKIESILDLPSKSPLQEKFYQFFDSIKSKKVIIASFLFIVLAFSFVVKRKDENKKVIPVKRATKKITRPTIKKPKVKPIKKSKRRIVKKKKAKIKTKKKISFQKLLDKAINRADQKANTCVKQFGNKPNIYRFKVTVSPKTGKLIRVVPLSQTPRRLIYCINESYSKVTYPKKRSKKEINFIKEFTLK